MRIEEFSKQMMGIFLIQKKKKIPIEGTLYAAIRYMQMLVKKATVFVRVRSFKLFIVAIIKLLPIS